MQCNTQKKAGYEVAAISRGTGKEQLARKLGAHHFIDSKKENPAEALKTLGGAKVILATAPNAKIISSLIGGLGANGDSFIKQMQENIAKAVVSVDILYRGGIDKRFEELQKELIEKANDKQDYEASADEIFRLCNQKQQSQMDDETQKENQKNIKELQNFIAAQATEIAGFDEGLVRRLIKQITVYPDHFTVEFKSGVNVNIKA